MYSTAYLVSRTYVINSIGVRVLGEETLVKIPVTQKSLSKDELIGYSQIGINPTFMLQTNKANYNGQDEIEYGGVRYDIYRSYTKSGMANVELYCKAKAGVTNGS